MEFDFNPSHEIIRLIGSLDEFKGAWKVTASLSSERLAVLKQIATIESVASSTRIEGSILSNAEVEWVLSGLKRDAFKSRDEQEVMGYADLMERIFESSERIALTEDEIKYLHRILINYDRHRGEYKKFPNKVVSTDQFGNQTDLFVTASPLETLQLMPDLIVWTREQLEANQIHPLLVIAAFVVKFLAIHPFQDGNGRLSRALTTLLLLKSGYAYVPFSSLESVIEKNKDQYYLALRKTQSSFIESSKPSDWEPWIAFFLRSMKKQQDHLSEKMEREQILQGELLPLAIQLLELIRQHGTLQSSQMVELTKESKSTIRLRLKELEERGHIVHYGNGRNTRYALKPVKNNHH